MKRINKKDILNIFVLTVLFILIVLFILKDKTFYGSILDWINQHSVIPEYFRTLFYKTHKLLPSFAPNLGGGQNIYNYAYYGLLNPIIMISYLFPFVSMKLYIQMSSVLLIYFSIILFYYFLRLNKYDENISLIGTISFMLASPLFFHSHRHIMFINYMPFLILALIGVNLYFEKKDKRLLCISTLLIILMSYYYSIPSIICIILYGIYKYISINTKITFKSFMMDGIHFLIPIIIGILLSCVLILPTFSSLLSGRFGTSTVIDIKNLIIPNINVKYLMYYSYGVGLTSISLISLILLFLSNKKENIFLSTILSILVLFPIFNYILNATMYIDPKVLIPFLPLYVISISESIKYVYSNKISIIKLFIISIIVILIVFITKSHYLYIFYLDYLLTLIIIILMNKYNYKKIFNTLMIILIFTISYLALPNNKLVPFSRYYNDSNMNQKELSKKIPNDYNHTTLLNYSHDNVNTINENINIYSDYIYSSIGNVLYNKFYYDIFENTMEYRNRSLLTANKNIMYLLFSNNKYLISDETSIAGYNEKDRINNVVLYENNDVLPFMYVSYNFMSNEDFNKYSFPYTNEILLNNTIIDKNVSNNYISNIEEIPLNKFKVSNVDENISINKNVINVAKKNSEMIIELDDDIKDKILFVSFDLKPQSCAKGDLLIRLNGTSNTLTCKEWKYYNANTTFNYVLSEKYRDNIKLTFNKGTYNISNIKVYYLSYENIKNINQKVTKVNIKDNTYGDNIYASVNAIDDGYFVTTIPYDKGFTVKVDGQKIDYEIVNRAFLGFKIFKGEHNIEIHYSSPLKNVGIILSIIGLLLAIIFVFRKGKIYE